MGWSVQENHPQATRPFAVVDDVSGMLMGSHPTKLGADTHRRLLMLADPDTAPGYQVTKSAGGVDVVRHAGSWVEGVRFVEPSMKEWGQLAQSEADQDLLDAVTVAGLGVVEGYASVYMIPDLVGDRMLKGCFGEEAFGAPYLAYHERAIGATVASPDSYGLRTLSTLARTDAAADFLELVKAKAIMAQSFGYQVPAGGGTANAFGGEDVSKCMVLECSGTPIPCNQLALITAVKAFGPALKSFAIPQLPSFRQDAASLRSASPPGGTGPGDAKMRTPEGVKAAAGQVQVQRKSIEGSFEDEIEDVNEALQAAIGGQGTYVYTRATFGDRVVYQLYSYGDDDEAAPQSGTYMATYSIDDTGGYSFGMPVPVEIQEVVSPKSLVRMATKNIGVLLKAGARHSAKDQRMIQDVHDTSVSLGATCDAGDDSGDGKAAGVRTKAHKTETSDAAWDGGANEKRLGDDPSAAILRSMYALPGDTKSDSKFPHHEVSDDGKVGAANVKACTSGIGILNGGRGGADVSDDEKKKIYSHLASHIRDSGGDPPELKAFLDATAIELELAALEL